PLISPRLCARASSSLTSPATGPRSAVYSSSSSSESSASSIARPPRKSPEIPSESAARVLVSRALSRSKSPMPRVSGAGRSGSRARARILGLAAVREARLDLVEDAVDERARVLGRVALAELDRLVDRHLGRDVAAVQQLPRRQAQHVAVDHRHARDVPVLRDALDD